MLEIYLTRHGQDTDNAKEILNGHSNTRLTTVGLKQVRKLAKELKQKHITFDCIYTSPLLRCRQTANTIARSNGKVKPKILHLLIERNFGKLTGKKISSISLLPKTNVFKTKNVTYFLKVEGAETFPELVFRAKRILKLVKNFHKNGKVLLVTHGDIGKMIYAAYYNIPWKEVLKKFHFNNSDTLLLSPKSPKDKTHLI